MKILITGGAGFIGSNLCEYLIKLNYKIVVIDNFSTGKYSNINNILNSIVLINHDIEDFDFNSLTDIDCVVHLAAQPSVPLSVTDFFSSSKINLLGTIRVIDYCRSKHVPLVYASSSAVYGNLELGDDATPNVDLLSPYATDKYSMELYSKTAFSLYGLSSIGLRFFNVYGPRQDPNSPYSGVISIFADRLLKAEHIVINGGNQTRDFVYVKDVAHVIHLSIELTAKGNVSEVVNVLTGKSISIDVLAEKMIQITATHSQKKYKELMPGDPERSEGTTDKMMRLFRINPQDFTTLDEGLIHTVDFIKAQADLHEKQ